MKLTIFLRLIAGYLAVFILMMGVGCYAILKLHEFNTGMREIMAIDNILLEYEEKLTESILSQSRYEKRFFITRDDALYRQFLSAKEDFNKYLGRLAPLVDSTVKKDLIGRVESDFKKYQALIDEELREVKTNPHPPRARYDEAKEERVISIFEALELLETYSRDDINQKLATLEEAARSTRELAITLSIVAIVLFVAISYFTTRGITRPMGLVMEMTKEISRGNFRCDLSISSPPEMGKLAGAFNLMCDRLRTVDKLKSDFFATMSHELRTPLTSIKEGTALLHQEVAGPITEKQKKLLTIISEESNRLIKQVNSLLDLSKMEAGMMAYHFEQGDLAALIEATIKEIEPIVEAKKIDFELTMDEGLPRVKMDQERMLQVMRNLLGNALKFTPEGGRVKVSVRRLNHEVKVSVTDTGPGIPQQNLETIFEKFRQAHLTDSDKTKGTGLGLTIVKHIITAHGGRVWAENEPGQGTSFTFVLSV